MRLDQPDEDAAEQVGPGVVRRDAKPAGHRRVGQRITVGRPVGRDRGEEIDRGVAVERLGQGQPLEGCERIRLAPAERQALHPCRLGGERQQRRAILHQRVVVRSGTIPFEHREFGMVQGAALAVAEDVGEAEQARLARREQLLAGEFRRGVQVERLAAAIGQDRLRCEGGEMRLVARRDLERRRLHLHEIRVGKPGAERREDAVAGQQQRPAIRMEAGMPPGRGVVTHAKTASGWQPSRG
ncbi:hypothetical protein CJNNKLLH_5066 [Methylorubrum thiocyanatum]|nr:hypothetical protein CJNNKLLH_5066 [Methylorubrum thiocyanatum]